MTLSELNEKDCFARLNGISLQSCNLDTSVAEMMVSERHLNGANVCQGGALFTLADLAAAGLTQGRMLTVDSDVRFLHPARLNDRLTATCRFLHSGRLSLTETVIVNQNEECIARITAQWCLR